jgi:hypothetical protein
MARILLDQTEVDVSEDVDDVLNRIVNSRDGLRHGSGKILAPAGWVSLTASDSGDSIFVQVSRIGCVRED